MPILLPSQLSTIGLVFILLLFPAYVWSAAEQTPAILAGFHGPIEYSSSGSDEQPTVEKIGQSILAASQVTTPADSNMQILFGKNYLVSLGPESTVNISDSSIELKQGLMEVAAIGMKEENGDEITIQTPNSTVKTNDGLLRVSVVSGGETETFVVMEGSAAVSSEKKGIQYVSLGANEAVRSENGVIGSLFQPEDPQNFLPICAINPHCISSKISPVAVSTTAAVPGPIVVEQVIIPPATISVLTTPTSPPPGPTPQPPFIPAP